MTGVQTCALPISGQVLQIGFVPHEETPRYLAAFDLLVLPSETQPNWKEQFGRVIVEALACGVPVIGSDSGEIPNLVLSRRRRNRVPRAERSSFRRQIKNNDQRSNSPTTIRGERSAMGA